MHGSSCIRPSGHPAARPAIPSSRYYGRSISVTMISDWARQNGFELADRWSDATSLARGFG
jgi:hypothetical protein